MFVVEERSYPLNEEYGQRKNADRVARIVSPILQFHVYCPPVKLSGLNCQKLIAFDCFWRSVSVFPPSYAEASVEQTAKGATKPWRSGLGNFRLMSAVADFSRRRPDIFNVLQYKIGIPFWLTALLPDTFALFLRADI